MVLVVGWPCLVGLAMLVVRAVLAILVVLVELVMRVALAAGLGRLMEGTIVQSLAEGIRRSSADVGQ